MQGRFLQADPLGINASSVTNPQTLNLYSFVLNDPRNASDPTALRAITVLIMDPGCMDSNTEEWGMQTCISSYTVNWQDAPDSQERFATGGGGGVGGGGGDDGRGTSNPQPPKQPQPFRLRVAGCRDTYLRNNYGNFGAKVTEFASPFSLLFTPKEYGYSLLESALVKGSVVKGIPRVLTILGDQLAYEAYNPPFDAIYSQEEALMLSRGAYAGAEALPAVFGFAGNVALAAGVFLSVQDAAAIFQCDMKMLLQ
jgi:hypothetical protein